MFGDHGMLDEGNHGGASSHEKQTILFAYATNHNFYLKNQSEKMREITQTNIAAILASIGGVNFPFSNIGLFEEEMILFEKEDESNFKSLILLCL